MSCETHEWVTADLGGVTFFSCLNCETTLYKEKGWHKI